MVRKHTFLFFLASVSVLGCYGMQEGSDSMDLEDQSLSDDMPGEDSGYQLCQAAASGNRHEVLRLLGLGVPVHSAPNDGITALHWAAMKNRARIIDDLIAHGTDVNRQSRKGLTPLFLAAEKGKIRAMQRLLTHGARTDLCDNAITPLLHAISNGQVRAVRTLLQHSTQEVNITDDGTGDGPLHAAVMGRNRVKSRALVMLLLRSGADSNLHNSEDGSTPLHFAASVGDMEIIWALLDNGAHADRQDFNSATPADDAWRGGQRDIARLLENVARTQNC